MPVQATAVPISPGCGGTVGHLLFLIRKGIATTRSGIAAATGLGRSTIMQRIDQLRKANLIRDAQHSQSTGGRPAVNLELNADAGVVLAADIGTTHSRLAVTDLAGERLAETEWSMQIADRVESVLSRVEETFESLLSEVGKTEQDAWGVGVGVPGPVETTSGRAINPPMMPGWHGYPIRDRLAERFGVPCLVDNDVNAMALGEHWAVCPEIDDLVFIKIGTGIGSGLILGGSIHRGANGAAGDLGHVPSETDGERCRCGYTGCLEASAGGWALARDLREMGYEVQDSRDVVDLVVAGNGDAIRVVREAGRLIGSNLASMVNVLNPRRLVVGGDLARSGDHVLAGIREIVYQRSTALSTGQLQIVVSRLDETAGIIGAAAMIIEHILSPEMVNQLIESTE
jgi:predicted NBD/HSP70 family sugar kinase